MQNLIIVINEAYVNDGTFDTLITHRGWDFGVLIITRAPPSPASTQEMIILWLNIPNVNVIKPPVAGALAPMLRSRSARHAVLNRYQRQLSAARPGFMLLRSRHAPAISNSGL